MTRRARQGRGGSGGGWQRKRVRRGWFVTADSNAHVERHVRRRRSGGAEKGPRRGWPGWREGCGARWQRRGRGVGAFGPGAYGDAVLIRARAKVSRGWRRVALATLVVPHPSGFAVGPKTTPERQPPLVRCLSLSLSLSRSPSSPLSPGSRSIRAERIAR